MFAIGTAELLILIVFFLVGLLVFLPLYLLPTIVAIFRKRPNTGVVAALNILLGWTCVGWVVALVLALGAGRQGPNGACDGR
mgnify:CR=1 FL=1